MEHHGDHHGGTPLSAISPHASMERDLVQRFIVSLLLTVPILALTPEVQSLFSFRIDLPFSHLVLLLLSTIVFLFGGWPFLSGFVKELRKRQPGMMTLIALAISVAYLYSSASVLFIGGSMFFWELATLIDIMLLGHFLEMRSVQGASRALEELAGVLPAEADVITEGGTLKVNIKDLRPGDKVLVRPGSKVPTDGEVMEGESDVNESLLTGESRPIFKAPGKEVIGGSINGDGSLIVRVTRTGRDSYLNQVIDMVQKAQESRSHSQDLADRAALVLTIVAIISGTLTLLAWLMMGKEGGFAVERAVTVMVICCPHALGLAIPLVVAISTTLAARSGFLVREREAFERARNVDTVVFDKTGTLTEGNFKVVAMTPLAGISEKDALAIAAAVESRSEHPIARGILASARDRGIVIKEVDDYRNIPGKGARATVEGIEYFMLSPSSMGEAGVAKEVPEVKLLSQKGRTVVVLSRKGEVLAVFALADKVRSESEEAVARLRQRGIRSVMITGDSAEVAEAVSGELGMDGYRASVSPMEKAAAIRSFQDGHVVAMVGDGINDAPALVQADVGIAIGAGTDVAVESADVVLVRNDPRDVYKVIELSRRTYSKMLQNLVYATGYNAVAIPLAAGVLASQGILLTPAIGAVLMSVSTIVVAINARLLRFT